MKSTHRVEVVRIEEIETHPNADTLGVVRCCGYQVVVRLADWSVGDLGAYVQPDSLVPLTGPFRFLRRTDDQETHHVKVMRLRGQLSQGLLIPAPAGSTPGDDVADILGVTRYVPPETSAGDAEAPSGWAPVYDLESARKYAESSFIEGEKLWITEKIHGENGRWTWRDGVMHSGSRTRWKDSNSAWARVLEHHPEIVSFCQKNPGAVVFGELYGGVGGFSYAVPKGQRRIAVFDIWHDGAFLPVHDLLQIGLLGVPVVGIVRWAAADGLEKLKPYAEGRTVLGKEQHVREGCVIRPMSERVHPEAGRVVLKLVGDGFLLK